MNTTLFVESFVAKHRTEQGKRIAYLRARGKNANPSQIRTLYSTLLQLAGLKMADVVLHVDEKLFHFITRESLYTVSGYVVGI